MARAGSPTASCARAGRWFQIPGSVSSSPTTASCCATSSWTGRLHAASTTHGTAVGRTPFVRNHFNELRATFVESDRDRRRFEWCSASTTTASASATRCRSSRHWSRSHPAGITEFAIAGRPPRGGSRPWKEREEYLYTAPRCRKSAWRRPRSPAHRRWGAPQHPRGRAGGLCRMNLMRGEAGGCARC